MKIRLIFFLIFTLVLQVFAAEDQLVCLPKKAAPVGRYCTELYHGVLMGILFGAVSFGISKYCHNRWSDKHVEGEDFGLMVIFGSAGFAVGNACGTYFAGNSAHYKGSFPATLLGSVLGTVGGLFALIQYEKWYPLLLPPAATILAYEMTRKPRSGKHAGNSLININQGQFICGIPAIGVQQNLQSNRFHTMLNLFEVRF